MFHKEDDSSFVSATAKAGSSEVLLPATLEASAYASAALNDCADETHINAHDMTDDAAAKSKPHVSRRATKRRARGLFAVDMSESMRPRIRTLVTRQQENARGFSNRYSANMGKLL